MAEVLVDMHRKELSVSDPGNVDCDETVYLRARNSSWTVLVMASGRRDGGPYRRAGLAGLNFAEARATLGRTLDERRHHGEAR
jgi:hypothetical protein